jgi:2'-5' RNA ligase
MVEGIAKPMARLFIALELPGMHRQRLTLLGGPLPGARWLPAEDLHLTLRFVGDVDRHAEDDLLEALAEIEAPPFELTIEGLGAFGGREPKVIWAGLAPSPPLEALQRAVERATRAIGLPSEERSFHPHVTLARLRGSRAGPVAELLQSRTGFVLPPFRVERFVVMSARPGGGAPYVVEVEFPLVEPDAA